MSQQDEALLNFPAAYASWRESGQDSSKANEIYELFRAHGRTHEVFRKAFSREIKANDSTFLRHSSSSLSLQLLNILFKTQISKKFIKRIVGAFLSRLLALSDTKRTNADVVELCVGFLRDKFTSRIRHCPVEIKMAFRELQRLLIKYKRPETLLESAFFLHYICPAVILPAEWDLISESPSGDQLQSLILACRFLQCAANATNFPDSDPRIGFSLSEAKTVMQRAMKSMLDLEDSPPTAMDDNEPDSRRALLGDIVKAAGRAKSVASSAKSRRASEVPLSKHRSQTMSSPQLSLAGQSIPEVAGEVGHQSDKSTLRNSDLRKSASFSKRRSTKLPQAGASTAAASSAAEAEAGAGSESDPEGSGSESPNNGTGQAKSPAKSKRTPLIQAIRNTAASKKRHSVALLSRSDSNVGVQVDEQPNAAVTSPNRSELIKLRVDIPPELKARSLLNLDQEKELLGDMLWRNQRTIVILLRSLTSAEGFVRSYVNRLTTSCSDLISSNRVGVVLIAYGHANAAQQLRKTLPFGYVVCIDKRRRIYDSLGCVRLHEKDEDANHDESNNSRSPSVESTPGESGSLTSVPSAAVQLGGVFGFAKHQLITQFIESNKEDQCDIEAAVRATLRSFDDESVTPSKPPRAPEPADDAISASHKAHSEAEIPTLRGSRSTSQDGSRRKTSSSRNLSKNL